MCIKTVEYIVQSRHKEERGWKFAQTYGPFRSADAAKKYSWFNASNDWKHRIVKRITIETTIKGTP